MPVPKNTGGGWEVTQTAVEYTCAECEASLSSEVGYDHPNGNPITRAVRFCHHDHVTILQFSPGSFPDKVSRQIPASAPRRSIDTIPDGHKAIKTVYDEARACHAAGAHTATVMLCRKILMNLAVEHAGSTAGGEDDNGNKGHGDSFEKCVSSLIAAGHIHPNWQDLAHDVRKAGNEATHHVEPKEPEHADNILRLVEYILMFVYPPS